MHQKEKQSVVALLLLLPCIQYEISDTCLESILCNLPQCWEATAAPSQLPGFDPRFQTGGFKTEHLKHVKSALFLSPILK